MQVVWDLISDVGRWPSWHPGIRSVAVDGPAGPGMDFRWRPGPYRIHSTVEEFWPGQRISWTGRSLGVAARHVWTIRPDAAGCFVHTDESMTGVLPRLLRRQLGKSLQRDLDTWLGHLKAEAQRPSAG